MQGRPKGTPRPRTEHFAILEQVLRGRAHLIEAFTGERGTVEIDRNKLDAARRIMGTAIPQEKT